MNIGLKNYSDQFTTEESQIKMEVEKAFLGWDSAYLNITKKRLSWLNEKTTYLS